MRGYLHIKRLTGSGIIALLGLLLAHCTKDPSIEEVGIKLRFINTSPDAASIQFKLNSQNGHTPALAYKDTTTYLSFEGGTYNLGINVGTATPINTIIDFAPRTVYSLFAVDSAKYLKLTVIKDDLTIPGIPLKARIRFFNLSPNSGGLILRGVANSDTLIISSGRSFNDIALSADAAKFQLLPSNVYDLLLYSGSTLVAKLPAQPLFNYKIYTIYARGFVGGTGNQALSIGVISNN